MSVKDWSDISSDVNVESERVRWLETLLELSLAGILTRSHFAEKIESFIHRLTNQWGIDGEYRHRREHFF